MTICIIFVSNHQRLLIIGQPRPKITFTDEQAESQVSKQKVKALFDCVKTIRV